MVCCGDDDEVKKEKELKGPLENRSCTDIIFLILFLVFWIGMFIIAGIVISKGNPRALIYGVDSYGNICGVDNDQKISVANSGLDLSDYKYLYFQDPTDDNALKLCVKTCPSTSTGTFCTGTSKTTCQAAGACLTGASPGDSAYSLTDANPTEIGNDGCFDANMYSSSAKFGLRYCFPDAADSIAQTFVESFFKKLNGADTFQQLFQDFGHTWQRIIYCCLIALGLSLLAIILLRWLAAIIIYGLILVSLIAMVILTVFLFVQWKRLKDDYDDTPSDQRLSSDKNNIRWFEGFMIASLVLTVLFFIIVIAMRNRIRLVVALFEEASKCIGSMVQILFSPLFTYIALIALFTYWVFVYVFLATSGSYTEDANAHADYSNSKDYSKMWWYHLFGLLWGAQFILASGQFVIASAVAMWYFTRDKSQVSSPYTKSVWRLIRYHLGSIAFGSFIIALVQLARIILAYIDRKLKGKAGKIVSILLKCLQCCLWCFEKCLKFLNENAYIEIAIYGYSFCKAARKAFMLIMSNILRVAAINSIGVLCIFIAKLAVVCGVGFIAILWMRNDSDLHYWAVVWLVIMVFAYFIADTFFDVYKLVIDTIFLCFVEDCDHNNGQDKPYFMSDNLLKFMSSNASNKEKKEPEEDKGQK